MIFKPIYIEDSILHLRDFDFGTPSLAESVDKSTDVEGNVADLFSLRPDAAGCLMNEINFLLLLVCFFDICQG